MHKNFPPSPTYHTSHLLVLPPLGSPFSSTQTFNNPALRRTHWVLLMSLFLMEKGHSTGSDVRLFRNGALFVPGLGSADPQFDRKLLEVFHMLSVIRHETGEEPERFFDLQGVRKPPTDEECPSTTSEGFSNPEEEKNS